GAMGYGNITKLKYILFLAGTVSYLGLILLITMELAVINRVSFPGFRAVLKSISAQEWCIAAFLLFALLSTLFSPYKLTAWLGSSRKEGLSTLILYITAFFMVSRFGSWKKHYLWLIVFTLGVNSVIAALQMSGKDPFGLFPGSATYHDAYILYNGEFLGTVGNADLFSALMCLLIPVAAVWSLRDKKKLPLLAVALLSIVVLALSRVAAGAVGIAGALVLTLPLVFAKSKKQLIIGYLISALVIVAAISVIFFFGFRLGGHFADIASFLRGSVDDSLGSGRIAIWKKVFPLLKERPILGGGPDTLSLRLDFTFERYIESKDLIVRSAVDTAHNEYLNLAVNMGLPAALLYIAALVFTAVACVKHKEDTVSLSIGAGMLAYLLQAFFCFSQCIVTPVFWIFWAMLDNRLNRIKEEKINVRY
ncbi:MAG: O-antigen ligase family protein, partial [Oscillospiraceae bacterium]|nr:O-antigen ligase family protein [Oscillospiraceae bacterium]